MVGEAIAGLGALKTAFDLAKGLKDINDAANRNAAIIDLQEKLLTAQSAQLTLLERLSELEKENAQLKSWDAEKQNYQLTAVGDGVFAYALKPELQSTEPSHLLCANCYQQGRKSHLQATQELRMRRRVHMCPRCKSDYAFSYVPPPPPPQVNRRYNPLRRG